MGESSESIHTTKKLKIIAWAPTSIQARVELTSNDNIGMKRILFTKK
jgi:hypothetical protein